MTAAPGTAGPIPCGSMNHINAAIDDFDTAVAHFRDVYGAQFLADMPRDEWHACLIAIGGVIFQLFAPHDRLLHARFGPHYVGIEYQVPDVEAGRRVAAEQRVRIIRELGAAFHVHPADALGVGFEFYDGDFHADPPPVPYLEPLHPAGWWRDHPSGITGLDRYRVAVADLAEAERFLGGFVSASVVERTEGPGRRATVLSLGDTMLELESPTGPGPLEQHVARYGDGIRSVVFSVADVAATRVHLTSCGLPLTEGDGRGAFGVAPSANCGLIFEFAPSR